MNQTTSGKGPVLLVDHHDLDFIPRGGPPGAAFVARAISNEISPNIGIGFEFDVIIAVILGGTSLAGGEGSLLGMIIGSLIIGSLGNGLKLMNVFTFFQSVMKGIVLVLAVLLDQKLKAGLRKLKRGAVA